MYVRAHGGVTLSFSCLPRPIPSAILENKYCVVDIGGVPKAISVDILKPHLGLAPVSAASPTRHGGPGPGGS